jgi:phasin family protein
MTTTFNTEQFLAAQKASFDTLFGLTTKAFEGVEKLVALNLQVAKTGLAEAADTAQAAFAAKDVQELLAMQASLLQPAADKASAYSRHVYDIVSGASADFTKAAEASVAEGQKQIMTLVDGALKNAPAGSESAVALMKSAVTAANNAFESVQKASKQAMDVAEANLQGLSKSAMSAAQSASKAAPKFKRAA